MQRAQELAQRLKQEQRIRELAQKGHDTSRLIKNLGVQVEFNESTNTISNSRHGLDEVSGKMNPCISSTNSPKKDTGVQTASEKYPKQLQKQREEKKVRRQMELLHLVERNNPGNLSQNRGNSPVLRSSHQETEPKFRSHLVKKEEEPLKISYFSKERSQSPQVPVMKNRTQQTLKKSNYERENLISGGNQTELSPRISEPSHFIPYVRTNEIYYLDPDAPLSRPLTQDPQYQNPHNCDQERQLFDSDRDPLLNPNLVKNRDRQQAILKGLSQLRQGLLQKQRELETNLMPLAANQEDNFSSSFSI
uniref:Coiled-coil domain containing 66 n=1 Tax=Pipistrellus kuhlii TaxID=59472 RepID=A0A7J7WBW2_PIPKU|nr:coiled-coil domain containing 66 [Pipistrellus kuhlii]